MLHILFRHITIDAFNTLAVKPLYSPLLHFAIDLLIRLCCQLQVLHTPGTDNEVAKALSRKDFTGVEHLVLHLDITQLTPPQDALGKRHS